MKHGNLQVYAGKHLLLWSKLVLGDSTKHCFISNDNDSFESYAGSLDEHYGRVICWIVFSAGAEYLAKGICIINDVYQIKENGKCFEYPPKEGSIDGWISAVAMNDPDRRSLETLDYGTLGKLYGKNLDDGPLGKLCKKMGAGIEDKRLLIASYRFLASTIRNRDAHAYVANVRGSHFYVVETLFARSLNLLLLWASRR